MAPQHEEKPSEIDEAAKLLTKGKNDVSVSPFDSQLAQPRPVRSAKDCLSYSDSDEDEPFIPLTQPRPYSILRKTSNPRLVKSKCQYSHTDSEDQESFFPSTQANFHRGAKKTLNSKLVKFSNGNQSGNFIFEIFVTSVVLNLAIVYFFKF
jgi:hypothetical protein